MRVSLRQLLTALLFTLVSVVAAANTGSLPQVQIETLEPGSGAVATHFSEVRVHYTGKLEDGTVFDSSIPRGEPIQFTLGSGQVIPGWEMGLEGMQEGERRLLSIPYQLAYGERGAGGVIPPRADLTFEVELVSVTPAPFSSIDNAVLEQKLKEGVTLIDIRRPEEWKETGVVEGSLKLTAFDERGRFLDSFLEGFRENVSSDDEVVLICRTGNRTASLSQWLSTEGGYENVVNVQRGIMDWIGEGRPVTQ